MIKLIRQWKKKEITKNVYRAKKNSKQPLNLRVYGRDDNKNKTLSVFGKNINLYFKVHIELKRRYFAR